MTPAGGLGVVAAAALLACGCRGKPTTPPQVFEGVVVKVACPDGPLAAAITNYGQVWGPAHGARVEIVNRTAEPDAPDLPPADLCLVAPADLPRWAAASRLLPVPAVYHTANNPNGWGELLRVYRNKLLVWDGQVYALPLLGHALLCYYRDDWFRDTSHQAAFQVKYGRPLAAPATWTEFMDVADFFRHRPRPGVSESSPSLPPLPATASGLDELYYSVAAPLARWAVAVDDRHPPPDDELLSFHYDFKTGKARIDHPAFVEAFRVLQRLQANRPPQPAPEPLEAFRDGRAALGIGGTEWVARLQDDTSPVRGRFGVCPVPGSHRVFAYQTGEPELVKGVNAMPYLGTGGWLGVVPRGAAHPEAAFALLAELSDPQVSTEIVLDQALGGSPFRRTHFDLLGSGNVFGLPSRVSQQWVAGLRQTLDPPIRNPLLRLRTPDADAHLRALVDEVRPALLRPDADPKQVMQAVARRWQELDAAKDERQRRADYCRSLSIPPER